MLHTPLNGIKHRLTKMNNEADPETDSTTTLLGIRVPAALREKIRQAAQIEGRTESGFARFYLGKAAEAALTESADSQPTTAAQ
jgi:uncharacterized protein (DUF1778 family)